MYRPSAFLGGIFYSPQQIAVFLREKKQHRSCEILIRQTVINEQLNIVNRIMLVDVRYLIVGQLCQLVAVQ